MPGAQSLDRLCIGFDSKLSPQLVNEEPAAHPDLSMDPPDRKLEPFLAEREVPGADMVIDAVDERSIEVEQEGDGGAHSNDPFQHPVGERIERFAFCVGGGPAALCRDLERMIRVLNQAKGRARAKTGNDSLQQV